MAPLALTSTLSKRSTREKPTSPTHIVPWLLTASAEIARPISAKYPAIWWAAFVDAGNAADRLSELRPALGYGVGVRWRSPVGPLRVDLAYGQETQKVRVHLSIGIAF